MDPITIPYFNVRVATGFASPATDYKEKRIDLNDVYVKHPDSTFIIDLRGDSMINAFRTPARAIIDRSLEPQNGDIVLASINGEFTVKFLKKNDHKCYLTPANSKYNQIEITKEMDFQIFGVITTILTDTKDLRKCML